MFRWVKQQKAFYHTLGPLKFGVIYLAALAYIAAYAWLMVWLSGETGWPEAYGSECHGRGCWPTNLWHSFRLLKVGTGFEIALFALLWHLPVTVGTFIAVVYARRKLKIYHERLRPLDD